jgi:hypothetical protein
MVWVRLSVRPATKQLVHSCEALIFQRNPDIRKVGRRLTEDEIVAWLARAYRGE